MPFNTIFSYKREGIRRENPLFYFYWMKVLKQISFVLLGFIILILALATIIEKIKGNAFVSKYTYSSVPFIILWGITAFIRLIYILKKNSIKN